MKTAACLILLLALSTPTPTAVVQEPFVRLDDPSLYVFMDGADGKPRIGGAALLAEPAALVRVSGMASLVTAIKKATGELIVGYDFKAWKVSAAVQVVVLEVTSLTPRPLDFSIEWVSALKGTEVMRAVLVPGQSVPIEPMKKLGLAPMTIRLEKR